ncbi:putative holin [Enterobacter sp. SST3]|uniref:putative holin n=1 Tax=Enterobacter sp. SST3 TaxID=1216470 RepID=UPI0002D2A461|nr:putative holin [Enterobacter sp. SST3]
MSDPVSGTTVAAGGLMGASMFGLATGIDYGVVFGAFAGAVFYVATAVNISRLKLVGYFITSFIFGAGVNMGPSVQTKWFQRWLNVFNIQGTLYPDLIADGFIGPRTISALKSYLSRRGKEGELVMLRALNCSQGQRYLELAEQRSANETFVYGWVKERVVI